jgi:hypothetical protein
MPGGQSRLYQHCVSSAVFVEMRERFTSIVAAVDSTCPNRTTAKSILQNNLHNVIVCAYLLAK